MAHYQITTAASGKCLQRLVEDVYDSNGNIVTNVLGDWEPCRKGTVGIGRGGTDADGGTPTMRVPQRKSLRSDEDVENERANIMLISVLVLVVGLIIYKLQK